MSLVNGYFYVTSNVGDAIGPWLMRAISGSPVALIPLESETPKVIVSGSILSLANSSCTVWGAGTAKRDAAVAADATILAVRGPLSRICALESGAACPPVYGDPALLMPRYYKPHGSVKSCRVGILPHFVDQERVFQAYATEAEEHPDDVLLIDVLRSPEHVIDEICSCERIVSSSLHGLILATAYGVPSVWVKFSNKVLGDGTKFYDFFLSIGQDPYLPIDLREAELPPPLSLGQHLPPAPEVPDGMLDALMSVCPFARKPVMLVNARGGM